jgi:uncharacterized integral membrane protein
MKFFKKAKLPKVIVFAIALLVIILLIFLIKNGWDVPLAVQNILELFGKGKK